MKAWRVALAGAGLAAIVFGAAELFLGVPPASLVRVAIWLAAALVIHDALWSPGLIGVGALLARVPARGRRYLQDDLRGVADRELEAGGYGTSHGR